MARLAVGLPPLVRSNRPLLYVDLLVPVVVRDILYVCSTRTLNKDTNLACISLSKQLKKILWTALCLKIWEEIYVNMLIEIKVILTLLQRNQVNLYLLETTVTERMFSPTQCNRCPMNLGRTSIKCPGSTT